jgi:hypothetical protein
MKQMTNFEKKLKTITVEEMARLMSGMSCAYCELEKKCNVENGFYVRDCEAYCKMWLESEVGGRG